MINIRIAKQLTKAPIVRNFKSSPRALGGGDHGDHGHAHPVIYLNSLPIIK